MILRTIAALVAWAVLTLVLVWAAIHHPPGPLLRPPPLPTTTTP